MKNLHLSAALYLEDLDAIWAHAFNQTPLNQQPRFIVEIDCCDGYLLKRAYHYVKEHTLRGNSLNDYPLEVIPLILHQGSVESVRRKLAEIPHRTVTISDTKPHTIVGSLRSIGVEDLNSCLFLDPFPEKSNFDSLALTSRFGVIQLQNHVEDTAQDYLLQTAQLGWLPKAGKSFVYPKTEEFAKFTLNHFRQHPFIIRRAALSDLPELTLLEEACWTKTLAMPQEVLANRIKSNPTGQLVIEMEGHILGVAYSQFIKNIEEIYSIQGETADTLHRPSGNILHILALNILSEKRKLQLGSYLLEFFLQLAALNSQVKQIFGVTRCLTYPGPEKISMDAFIKEKNPEGLPLDYVLRTHVQHGGEIQGTVPHYRPKDSTNDGHGVLINYSKHDRKVMMKSDRPIEEVNQLSELIYSVEWKKSESGKIEDLPYDGVWLIFSDEGEKIAQNLREVLRERRQYCIIVQEGVKFGKNSEESYVVNPLTIEDFELLFSSLSNISQLSGVIYLWSYLKKIPSSDFQFLQSFHKKNSHAIVSIANVLDTLNLTLAPKIWVIGQSLPEDGNFSSLAQWPLALLCQVVSDEYPQFPCIYLALDAQEDPSERIYSEIASKWISGKDCIIARRGGQRFVPRIVSYLGKPLGKPVISSEASYLIAAGYSPLGLIMARWYIDHGAKTIILMDEAEPSPDKKIKLEELRATGVTIRCFHVPFDDEAGIKAILETIGKECPHLKGIIHVVPLIEDDLLGHLQWENFQRMYRFRVMCSWFLHQLTQSMKLDHFVLFSSIVNRAAPSGKASQAFAVAFLEALSYYRQKLNFPSLTIGWGVWSTKQAIVKHVIEKRKITKVLEFISAEESFRIMDICVCLSDPFLIAAKIKWADNKISEEYPFFIK